MPKPRLLGYLRLLPLVIASWLRGDAIVSAVGLALRPIFVTTDPSSAFFGMALLDTSRQAERERISSCDKNVF